jgi:hypothetical protein
VKSHNPNHKHISNLKSQIPNKFQIPIHKLQTIAVKNLVLAPCLVFGACLYFGAWSLVLV